MDRNFLIAGDAVGPTEGITVNGHSEGFVLDVWIDGTAELAEIEWSNGDVGTWPTAELVRI